MFAYMPTSECAAGLVAAAHRASNENRRRILKKSLFTARALPSRYRDLSPSRQNGLMLGLKTHRPVHPSASTSTSARVFRRISHHTHQDCTCYSGGHAPSAIVECEGKTRP